MWMVMSALALGAVAGIDSTAQEVTPVVQDGVPTSPPVVTIPTTPDPSERVFGGPAGLVLNAVRADGTDDFEMVLTRLAEALANSPNPIRRQQAEGWRVFRAAESGPNSSVLYVFVVDPVVPGADYGVARVLAEAFPNEAGELYVLYSGAYADGQTLLNLDPVEAFGRSVIP